MKILEITLSKKDAVILNKNYSKARRKVRYLDKFDCQMVYRLGTEKDTKISKVRV